MQNENRTEKNEHLRNGNRRKKKYNIETKELQRELSEHTAQVNEKSV